MDWLSIRCEGCFLDHLLLLVIIGNVIPSLLVWVIIDNRLGIDCLNF